MAHGGKRPGAGRKPKGVYPPITEAPKYAYPEAPKYAYREGETPFTFAQRVLTDELPALLTIAVYKATKEGDTRMLIHCIDRLLGSPVQPIDLEVKRAAELMAAASGAEPDWLIKRAQEIAAKASEGTAV